MLCGVSKDKSRNEEAYRDPLCRWWVHTEELERPCFLDLFQVCEKSGRSLMAMCGGEQRVLAGVQRRGRSMRGTAI